MFKGCGGSCQQSKACAPLARAMLPDPVSSYSVVHVAGVARSLNTMTAVSGGCGGVDDVVCPGLRCPHLPYLSCGHSSLTLLIFLSLSRRFCKGLLLVLPTVFSPPHRLCCTCGSAPDAVPTVRSRSLRLVLVGTQSPISGQFVSCCVSIALASHTKSRVTFLP